MRYGVTDIGEATANSIFRAVDVKDSLKRLWNYRGTLLACIGDVKSSRNRPEEVQWVPGRLRPRIFRDIRHYKGGRLSAIRTDRLYSRRNPWYSFSGAESTPGHMVPSGRATKKPPVTPPRIDPKTARLVAQCLNHYTTPGYRRGKL